jgi:hypothetical protein
LRYIFAQRTVGASRHPAFPAPSWTRGWSDEAKLGRNAPRGREGVCMTVILSAISRTIFSVTSADVAKHALLLAGACAFVFLLSLTHGLDLSAGFF